MFGNIVRKYVLENMIVKYFSEGFLFKRSLVHAT